MHKVALAGCGRISKNHIESLLKLREEGIAEIVSCCDVIPERAHEAAEKIGNGCKPYNDFSQMLKEAMKGNPIQNLKYVNELMDILDNL